MWSVGGGVRGVGPFIRPICTALSGSGVVGFRWTLVTFLGVED